MLDERIVRLRSGISLFVASTAQHTAETLLVVHGGPDWDHSYLREPLSGLCGCHRVVFCDLRGCGRSSRGLAGGQYTPDAAVSDLLALADMLNVARFSVLGFSYGGLLAQRLAVVAPERVDRLVIASSSVTPVDTAAYGEWPERDRRIAVEAGVWADPSLSGPELTRAAAIAGAQTDVWRREAMPGYLARLEEIRFSAEWLGASRKGTLPSAHLDDPITQLGDTTIPILLLHGAHDMRFPAAHAVDVAARLENAEAIILTDAGHMTHVDQPHAWMDAVSSFLHL